MRRRFAVASLIVAACCVAGCDAGDRARTENTSPGPEVRITSPRMDQVIQASMAGDVTAESVETMIDLRNYEVGRVEEGKSGQHLHVIVDDQPYLACYDASKAFPVGKLKRGSHVLRVFPSAGPKDPKGAAHHESRKNPGAFAWVRFHVGERAGPLAEFDGAKPLLTYSRPKGEYETGKPETERLILDFYVTGCALSEKGYRVRAMLDGTETKEPRSPLTEWKADYDWRNPYVLKPTPAAGKHTVVLELIDGEGKTVPGPFNRTEREITIK